MWGKKAGYAGEGRGSVGRVRKRLIRFPLKGYGRPLKDFYFVGCELREGSQLEGKRRNFAKDIVLEDKLPEKQMWGGGLILFFLNYKRPGGGKNKLNGNGKSLVSRSQKKKTFSRRGSYWTRSVWERLCSRESVRLRALPRSA